MRRGAASALGIVLAWGVVPVLDPVRASAAVVPMQAAAGSATPVAPTPVAEKAYSVQLHVHGSFSEGPGSIDSHSWEATQVGADVLWWSDHDFRITSYGHESTFGFDDWSEPLVEAARVGRDVGTKSLTRIPSRPRSPDFGAEGQVVAELVAADADEGARSLRLSLTGPRGGWLEERFEIAADRGLLKRPLAAGVTLELSIDPEEVGPEAQALVDVALSEHAPHGELGLVPYAIRYVVGDEASAPYREGSVYVVPLRATPGRWSRLALDVGADAVRGFPWMVAADNSFGGIFVGVRARAGARVSVRFDRLRVSQRISGPAMFAVQRDLIAEVGRRYPGVIELQGVEISYAAHHLNEFSVETELLDYGRLLSDGSFDGETSGERAEKTGRRDRIARAAVAAAHARGGLVSFNHMFGAGLEGATGRSTREETLARLVESRVLGADLLEVGYRDRGGHDLADHLWVWDQLALRGLHPVGIGVSDSHGGADQRWATGKNNFLSWIYARSPSKADLIAGMRAGRVFFGDLTRFRGRVDLSTPEGFRMGQVVVTERLRVSIRAEVTGGAAVSGAVLRFVRNGEVVSSAPIGLDAASSTYDVELAPNGATAVRVEVGDGNGGITVLSNPITFVRGAPPTDIAPERLVLDAGAPRSTDATPSSTAPSGSSRAQPQGDQAAVRSRRLSH